MREIWSFINSVLSSTACVGINATVRYVYDGGAEGHDEHGQKKRHTIPPLFSRRPVVPCDFNKPILGYRLA